MNHQSSNPTSLLPETASLKRLRKMVKDHHDKMFAKMAAQNRLKEKQREQEWLKEFGTLPPFKLYTSTQDN